MRENPSSVKFRDMRWLVERLGWRLSAHRRGGSHWRYEHAILGPDEAIILVKPHRKDVMNPINVKRILAKLEITIEFEQESERDDSEDSSP